MPDARAGKTSGPRKVVDTTVGLTAESNKVHAKDGEDVRPVSKVPKKELKLFPKGDDTQRQTKKKLQKRGQEKLPSTICVGMAVSSYFLNKEAYVNCSVGEVVKLRQQWAEENRDDAKILKLGWEEDGKWYDGTVTSIIRNKFKVPVYTCTFQTPDWDKLDLNYAETKKMLKSFVDLHAYRKKQREDDEAADVARSRADSNQQLEDTNKLPTSTFTKEDKADGTSSESEEIDDAALSELDDHTNVKSEGGTSAVPSNNPPMPKTMEEMALKVSVLTRQVSILTRICAGPNVPIKSEFPTSVHVKTEGIASDAPIDLVTSSSEDSSNESSATDGSQPPAYVGSAKKVSKDLRKSRTEDVEGTVRIRTARTTLRTPSYTKGKQRRDCSRKNWETGIKRNTKETRINEEILEATADNLPQILRNMRVGGFGITKNCSESANYLSISKVQTMKRVPQSREQHLFFRKETNQTRHKLSFPKDRGGIRTGLAKRQNTTYCSKVLSSIRKIGSSRRECPDRKQTICREDNHVSLWHKKARR